MPTRYPPEFRRKVLDLLKAGRTVAQLVRDLQISDQTIYNRQRRHSSLGMLSPLEYERLQPQLSIA